MIYAALLWIAAPIAIGLMSLLFLRGTTRVLTTVITSGILFLAALLGPPGAPIPLFGGSIYVEPVFSILGRSFILQNSTQLLLLNVYGFGVFWFIGAFGSRTANALPAYGLMVFGVLIAAISIQPFLYAAVFIEFAVLLSVPLLLSNETIQPRAILPFLLNQSLAFPFILLAGFLLSGINTPQTELKIITQGILMLAIGFAFLLSIFPLYSWAPILSTQIDPHKLGFILTIFPFFSLILGEIFIDRFAFLRASSALAPILEGIGLLMILSSSLFASVQTRLDRLFAYVLVSLTGFGLLALSLPSLSEGITFLFIIFHIHFLSFGLWSFAVSDLRHRGMDLTLDALRGVLWRFPFAASAILVAMFTIAGSPILALFPIKISLWTHIVEHFPDHLFLYGASFVGFWASAARVFTSFTDLRPNRVERAVEKGWRSTLIIIAICILIVIGIFPNLIAGLNQNAPTIFGVPAN